MNIDFYTCTSKTETVQKVLTKERIMTGCKLLDATNVINPTVLIRASDIATLADYNYLRIPQFNRYYYISNMEYRSNVVAVSCEVDAVFSWYHKYKNTSQLVTRSENIRNRYIQDGSEPIHSDNFYTYVNFGINVFDKKCDRLILTTAGKGSLTASQKAMLEERSVENG